MPTDITRERVWELRVHGVGNSPPESLLRTCGDIDSDVDEPPRVRRVAGGSITGFFRREAATDDPIVVEAYSWGGLTAGRRRETRVANLRRAGWTLLLPFALCNLSLWARPRVPYDPDERGAAALTAWLVRAFALGLTCIMLLSISGAAMDVIAWQCQPNACGGPGFIHDFLQQGIFRVGARRALAGATIPLLVIAVFYWLAGSSFHYEAVTPTSAPRGREQTPVDTARTRLEHPQFWRGAAQVRALRLIHTGAGLDIVAHALAGCLWFDQDARPAWTSTCALVASAIAGVGMLSALVALTRPVIRVRGAPAAGRGTRALLAIPGVTGVVALTIAGVAAGNASTPDEIETAPTMYGLDETLRIAFLLMFLALLALMILCARQAEAEGQLDRGADSSAWQGLGVPVFLGASWLVAIVYSVSLLYGAESWMGGPGGASRAHFPAMMEWNAVGVLLCAIVGVLIAVAAGLLVSRVRRTETRALRSSIDEENWHALQRAGAVGSARGLHRYVGHNSLRQLGWLATSLFIVLAAVVTVAAGRRVNFHHDQRHPAWQALGITLPDAPDSALISAAAALATLILLALVALGYAAHRYPVILRTLGILWDVVTFWPRGAHPFAPPCYAEQAVPQLVTRIEGRPAIPTILAGHSQGSILCAATVAQLTPGRRENLFLLTFGSQLTPLYGRAFPAFFAIEGRQRLAKLLGGSAENQPPWAETRWRNLYRDTDFLGWPIAANAEALNYEPDPHDLGLVVDRPVKDPTGLDPSTGTGLVPVEGEITDPPIRTHFDYPLVQEYFEARNQAADHLLNSPVRLGVVATTVVPTATAPAPNGPSRTPVHHWRAATMASTATLFIAMNLALLPNHLPPSHELTAKTATPQANATTVKTSPSIRTETGAIPASIDHPQVVDRVAVGTAKNLAGMVLSADGRTLYIADVEGRKVWTFDTATRKPVLNYPVGLRPRSLALSPDGSKLYVTLFVDGCDALANDSSCKARKLTTIDLKTGIAARPVTVAGNAYAISVDRRTGTLFIPDHLASGIVVLDTLLRNRKLIRMRNNPHSIAFSPDGRTAYVADHESDKVQVVDLRRGRIRTTISLPANSNPHFVAASPRTHEVYAAEFKAGAVGVIDTLTSRYVMGIPTKGKNPQAIAFAPDGRHAYVVNNGSSDLTVVDTTKRSTLMTIKLAPRPTTIVVSPNGRFAYVSGLGTGAVTIIRIG